MSLTIVITTFNREAVLRQLLESLEAQTDSQFEVVVAIDGGTDATEAMLESLRTRFPLRWVNTHCKGYGLAVARNLGILAARTELVAIIDDDCFPEPGFVAAHKASAKRRTITGGPRTPSSGSDARQLEKMRDLDQLPSCEAIPFERLHREWPKAVATECNICLYRSDLVEMGLFSERLKIYGFIGQEFFARARHYGFMYQYNPGAEIVHRRQPLGDNDLSGWRRKWQIIFARALGPSLMNGRQFEVQAAWAKCMLDHYPNPCGLPPLPRAIWIEFPYKFARNRAADLRRFARRMRARA